MAKAKKEAAKAGKKKTTSGNAKKKMTHADLKKIKGGGSENKQSLNSCG